MITKAAILTAISLLAGIANAEMKSAHAVHPQILKTESTLLVQVDTGFHVNELAPVGIFYGKDRVAPTSINAHEARFAIKPKTAAIASLYVCDDPLTVCEKHDFIISENLTLHSGTAFIKTLADVDAVDAKEFKKNYDEQFAHLLRSAKNQQKLVMVNFTARWCPGCQRMKKEVLSTKEFKQLESKFLNMVVDVDTAGSIKLKERFAVKGIPTFILVSSDGDELDRIYDYVPISAMQKWVETVSREPISLKQLKEKSDKGDLTARRKVAENYFAQFNYSEAWNLFKTLPEPWNQNIYISQIESLARTLQDKSTPENTAALIKAYEDALAHYNDTLKSLGWRREYAALLKGKDDEKRKKLLKEGIALVEKMQNDRTTFTKAMREEFLGEMQGFELFYLAWDRAELIAEEQAADAKTKDVIHPKVKAAWRAAARLGEKSRMPQAGLGPAIRYISVLKRGGELPKALAQVEALIRQEKDNGDLLRRKVDILMEMKKYAEAEQAATNALPKSYGRNEVWCAAQKAKAMIELKKKDEAKKLLQTYLERSEIKQGVWTSEKTELEELLKST